ncbi:unnamed protein product [Malus baccata var. baccata]
MASEQQQRRENTTPEREVYIEKDKVPKMTTHFEALTVHAADTRAGRKDTSLDSSSKQSSQHDDKLASMRSGNTVGDVGMGKARETYEIRSHKLESLRDTQASTRDDGQRELQADKVDDKEAESKKKSQGGAGGHTFEQRHEKSHGRVQGGAHSFKQHHEGKRQGGARQSPKAAILQGPKSFKEDKDKVEVFSRPGSLK